MSRTQRSLRGPVPLPEPLRGCGAARRPGLSYGARRDWVMRELPVVDPGAASGLNATSGLEIRFGDLPIR